MGGVDDEENGFTEELTVRATALMREYIIPLNQRSNAKIHKDEDDECLVVIVKTNEIEAFSDERSINIYQPHYGPKNARNSPTRKHH